MIIQTNDIDLIEEMFSRLNEAVPLSAAEKRNGRGGPLRGAVRGICNSEFFVDRLPFGNRRYRHYDIATKFLYFMDHSDTVDTKKSQLDSYWQEFKTQSKQTEADSLKTEVLKVLTSMTSTFESNDRLLGSVGMLSLYFLLYKRLINEGRPVPKRQQLVAFNQARNMQRVDDEEDLTPRQRRLLEFDRYSQSPNDGSALDYRLSVLTDYLADPASFA